ncbi:MAG: thioredoxin domain-containing protein [Patescibacteria group bacterium]
MKENSFEGQEQKKKWYTRWWAFILFVFLIMIFAFLPLFLFQTFKIYREVKNGTYVAEADLTVEPPYDMKEVVSATSASWGAPNPKVEIVVFGDFNCSKSKETAWILRELLARNQDILKIYWRNLPILSQSSYELAMAGVCAGRQDQFLLAYEAFWDKQGTLNDQITIWDLLLNLGLNKKKLDVCLNNVLTEAEIKKDYFVARDLEISGTPTFFVNGYRLQGHVPLIYWEQLIKKLVNVYDKKVNPN